MPSLSTVYKDLDFKVNYWLVKSKQKYYSNENEPRVIQTRFKDQPLFSLRTIPRDNYLVKPGEFLSLTKKLKVKKSSPEPTISSTDYEQYLHADFLNPATPPSSQTKEEPPLVDLEENLPGSLALHMEVKVPEVHSIDPLLTPPASPIGRLRKYLHGYSPLPYQQVQPLYRNKPDPVWKRVLSTDSLIAAKKSTNSSLHSEKSSQTISQLIDLDDKEQENLAPVPTGEYSTYSGILSMYY